MTEAEQKFWRAEFAMLDTLYRKRQQDAQRLVNKLDLRFDKAIRDLQATEFVKTSEFYPTMREILATLTMNYPRLFFDVTDDEAYTDDSGLNIADIYERASTSLLEITQAREHVSQATLDAAFCQVGWIGTDFNPAGDDIIAPWTANSQDEEDLVSFSRRPPFYVHVDPMTPPHMLGHARYIREKMWVPLQYLRDDKTIKNRLKIKATGVNENEGVGFGELLDDKSLDDEVQAMRDAVSNGEFVLVDRVHVRARVPGFNGKDPRRMLMFVPGEAEPVKEVPHPFIRRTFTQRMEKTFDPEVGMFGSMVDRPMVDPETGEPVLDLETLGKDGEPGEPARGWLVPNGFPLTPVKLDMHPTSFYPKAHFAYLEDVQDGIVESLSRQAALLKRFSRLILANQAEQDGPQGAEIGNIIQRGEDGELVFVVDKENYKAIDFGGTPSGQLEYEDRLRAYAQRISQMRQSTDASRGAITATQAAILGAAADVNQQWGEASISRVYCGLVRCGFTIMGDPRFTPEAYRINVAPDGQQRFTRALRSADFQWNYKITVQAGSMQPMFAQMQQDKMLAFYDRAIQNPDFEKRELSKMLADAFDQDPDKLLVQQSNTEAQRAAQLENRMMISEGQDPEVLQEQDHRAHVGIHQQITQDPAYQELQARATQRDMQGLPLDMQAAQRLQQINAVVQQHLAQHQAAEKQSQQAMSRPGTGAGGESGQVLGLIGQVRSNAQETADAASVDANQERMS